jgi:HPt (histidine-containing phosphotransfer) domain-containing protein
MSNPVLNLATIESLRDVERRGGKPFVKSLVRDYLAHMELDLHAIEVARGAGNNDALRKHIHAAAGAARAVGAQAMIDCLESAAFREAKASQFDAARQVAREVGAAFEALFASDNRFL